MKVFKKLLISFGIALTFGLFIYGSRLHTFIKVQDESIKFEEKLTKIDTTVLHEYKKNIKIMQHQSDCKTVVDSMINKSKFLK